MNKRQQTEAQLREEVVALRHQLAALQAREADHQRVEEALRESRRFFQSALDAQSSHLAILDETGTIIAVNAAWCRFAQVNQLSWLEYGMGKNYLEICAAAVGEGAEEARIVAEGIREVMAAQRAEFCREYPCHSPSEQRWFTVHVTRFHHTEPVRVLVEHENITERRRGEEALRESEERYRNLFENANDAIATITLDGTITGVNRAAELLLGWSREEMIGQPAPRFATPASMALAEERTRRFLAGEKLPSSMFEAELVRKDGSIVPVEVRTRAIRAHTGQPIGFQGIYRDITERRRAQEALRRSENRLALIFNGVSDMLALLQVEDGFRLRYLAVNAAYLRTMRLTELQVVGKVIEEVLPPETVTLTKAKTREAMQARKPLTYEVSVDLPTGRLVIETTLSSIVDPQGNRTHLLAVGHDVTERKRAEAALQTLSRQLLEAQETERRAIARELHDELGQALQALKINLQTAQRFPKERAQRLEDSIGIVDHTLQKVRNLSLDLRPSLLDDLGLVAALDWYIDRQAQRVGFAGHFVADPLEPRPSPVVETACFRVVQEALTNVSRHAQARQVWVQLRQHEDGLHLLIRDDGVGFDVRTAQERAAQGESLGIIGMQERVVLVGGQIEITSIPTRGTEIRAYFPLSQPLAFSTHLAVDS